MERSVVALSEDGKWLVVLEGIEGVSGFAIYRFDREFLNSWRFQDTAEDTGQGADEVLAAWLEGRHEG